MNILNRKILCIIISLLFWPLLKVYAQNLDCEKSDGACGDMSLPSAYIKFKNRCNHPVRLAIYYKDIMGNWKGVSWYSFSSNEQSFLSENGKKLTTTISTLYYYAETTDNSRLAWVGNHNYSKLKMRKIKDTKGNIEWAIDCKGK